MSWIFHDSTPIYLQLVDRLQLMIANGTYPPGSKMPAVRELALEAGVNPNTVQRAMSELERAQLLFAQRTSGRFVTTDEEMLKQLKTQLSENHISHLFNQLNQLGFETDEIVKAVQNYALDKE